MGWKPVLQNELPMVTIPIQPGDSSSHASSRATAPPSVCSQETQEAAKSVGFGLGFTLCLLSLLSGHAAATLGALAARGSSRPTVVAARGHSNTSAGLAGALRLGPNCAAPEGPAAATYTQALSELHEASARVGYGRLGKGSRLGFEGIRAKVQGVAYHQVVSMHPPSGWTAGGAFATFALPPVPSGDDTEQTPGDGGAAGATRRWCALRGAVAINDGNNWIGRAGSPLTFSVRDGTTDELLWLSEPIQDLRLALPKGLRTLKLQVHLTEWLHDQSDWNPLASPNVCGCILCPPHPCNNSAAACAAPQVEAANSNACAHAVWVDPVLLA